MIHALNHCTAKRIAAIVYSLVCLSRAYARVPYNITIHFCIHMNNPSPNNQRNMRRAVALLAIVLALLLCFRLCKHKTTEDPIPPPTQQETAPTKAAPQHASGRTHPKRRDLRTRKDAGRKGIKRRTNTEPTTPKKEEKYGSSVKWIDISH